MKKTKRIDVAIVMGSESDLPTMKEAQKALKTLQVSSELFILSAHRTPDAVAKFSQNCRKNGFKVIIAGAGGAAHLPGMIAAYTELPVIGVPVAIGVLKGYDALLSIAQMPKGVPVATVAIGNAWNAGILAAQILGTTNVLNKIKTYKQKMKTKVLKNSKKSQRLKLI